MVYAIGVTPREIAELVTYKLKDVSQVLFEQWRDEIPLGECLVDWEVFILAIVDRLFPLEWREKL